MLYQDIVPYTPVYLGGYFKLFWFVDMVEWQVTDLLHVLYRYVQATLWVLVP